MKRILLIITTIILTTCQQKPAGKALQTFEGHSITADHGMVVSAHPQSSRIGVSILQKGGNAVDAAVAAGFALAVCYPEAGNIGGGGFMLIRTAEGEYDMIDYREKAPLNASKDMYLDADQMVIGGLSTETHLAAGVPGSVDGMIRVHSKYGKLSFREVIQPAIDLARNGFRITKGQAQSLNWNTKNFRLKNPSVSAFVKDPYWNEEDTLRQPDLAETLERIRDYGRDGFYSGKTAELFLHEMKRGNGLISVRDLEEYSSVIRKPLSSFYRNYKVITIPPSSGGGIILLQLLGMVENYPMSELGFHSVKMIHLITEAERRAFADRAKFAGDADFVRVPVNELISRDYLTGRLADFNKNKATISAEINAGSPEGYESTETTHYSVVDTEGNAVSATTTLNGSYGSSIVVSGAGFLLNNEMDDFSIKSGFPNMFGFTGSDTNAIEPAKRMLISMSPVIVEKDGKLFLVAGSPGGSTIPTTVFQVIINVIDYNMNIREAVDTGRFHHKWMHDRIIYEKNRIDFATLGVLKKMGHMVDEVPGLGKVNAIRILPEDRIAGVADRRGNNSACGY